MKEVKPRRLHALIRDDIMFCARQIIHSSVNQIREHKFESHEIRHQKRWICDEIVDQFKTILIATISGDESPSTIAMFKNFPVDITRNSLFREHDEDLSEFLACPSENPPSSSEISSQSLPSQILSASDLPSNQGAMLKRKRSEEDIPSQHKKLKIVNDLQWLVDYNIYNLTFFDLETTGLDTEKSQIVQICVKRYDLIEDTWETKESLISPLYNEWSKEAEDIHGISQEQLQDAPLLSEIWGDIFGMMSGSYIVGYNINDFDYPLLKNNVERHNMFMPNIAGLIDLHEIFKSKQPKKSKRLCNVYQHYTGKQLQNSHNATADTEACVEILKNMIKTEDFHGQFIHLFESEMDCD